MSDEVTQEVIKEDERKETEVNEERHQEDEKAETLAGESTEGEQDNVDEQHSHVDSPQQHEHDQEQLENEEQLLQDEDNDSPSEDAHTTTPQKEIHAYYSNITDDSVSLGDRLSKTLQLLWDEKKLLQDCSLKEYDRIDELKDVLMCAKYIGEEFEKSLSTICRDMGGIREALEDIQGCVDRKLTSESLVSWLSGPPAHPADKKGVLEEKKATVRGAKARASIARTTVDGPKIEERVARLEKELEKALGDAEVAAQEAEEAARLAEEARQAAERKAKADEEARLKAEEAKRKKEEEERKRKEEEERKKREREAFAGTPEEIERQKKEAERRNFKNWPPWVYSVDPSDIDIPIGCVIRAIPGSVSGRDAFTVKQIDQIGGPLVLEDHEELVSHIFSISLSEDDHTLKLEEPLAVAIPHCAPRNIISREPVVKILSENGNWKELPTEEVSIEDIKEFKFVQTRLQGPATLAVVSRFRREKFNVGKKGAKLFPMVDGRVCFSFKPAMYKHITPVELEVQPVELSAVTDLRNRYPAEADNLLASSPILSLKLPTKTLNKPIIVQVPVPPNPQKKQRPMTAVDKESKGSSTKARPTSAFSMAAFKKEEEPDDALYLMHPSPETGLWTIVPEITLQQAKNKDFVTFEMEKEAISKIWILRIKSHATHGQVDKIANLLDRALKHRVMQFVLRQQNTEPCNCMVSCTNANKLDRLLRRCEEEGYETGPSPSKEIIVKEGQEMTLSFRGNVKSINDVEQKFVFNSYIKSRVDFTAGEIDPFAQKGIDCFRGFAQAYTIGEIKKEQMEEKSKKPNTNVTVGPILLTEMLISLPKPPTEAPKRITRAPVVMKTDDVISNELLHHLAAEIGEEWKKLAQKLNIRQVRIQAILRNNISSDTEHSIYDMLVTWAKKVPRSVNKIELLCQALSQCGRPDLVEELKDKDHDFKKARAVSARKSYLRQSFVKVAQNEHVALNWKYLCRHLGLSEPEINDVENEYNSSRDRCFQALLKWQEVREDIATVEYLIRKLKKCKYHDVAAQVKHVISA